MQVHGLKGHNSCVFWNKGNNRWEILLLPGWSTRAVALCHGRMGPHTQRLGADGCSDGGRSSSSGLTAASCWTEILRLTRQDLPCFCLKASQGQELPSKCLFFFLKVDIGKLMTSLGPPCSPGATQPCPNNSHGEDLGCLLQEERGFTAAHDPLLPSPFGKVSGATALPPLGVRVFMEGSPRGPWAT